MSHIGSFLWALASFSVGAHVVVARTFDAGEILPLLARVPPHVLAMIPAALTALVRDHDVTADRLRVVAAVPRRADKVSLELEHEFSDLVGFLIDEGYGMTEVGLATLNPPRARSSRDRSAGRSPASTSACATRSASSARPAPSVGCGSAPAARPSGTGRTPRRPPRSSATAGSTPATSPAPTTTATCGSSAARSRSSCTTARTSARARWRARWPSIPPSRSSAWSASTTRCTARTCAPT